MFIYLDSDEKYTFESLIKNVAIDSQALLSPIPVPLTSQQEYVALDHLDWIIANGFELQVNESGERSPKLFLTRVPQLKNLTLGISGIFKKKALIA